MPFTRIVAAVDFSVASAVALRTAMDVAKNHGARVTMVHAMNWPGRMVYSSGEAARLVRRLPAEARSTAERLKRKARAIGAEHAEPAVVTGIPYRGIVETAATRAADLIVIGVAPRTSIDEAAFGSTLRSVLRRAETPVLVVPAAAGALQHARAIDPPRDIYPTGPEWPGSLQTKRTGDLGRLTPATVRQLTSG